MTWDAASFKARWTEFAPTADARVTSAIAEATAECDARVFGDSYEHAVGLLAAHKLAVSPFGQQARQESKDGATTTYHTEWEELARKRGGGFYTIGYYP